MSNVLITILVVDDQPLMRDGIVSLLGRQPDLQVVAQASNGLEAIEQAKITQPNVILMDIRMSVMDGISAAREILALQPDAKILMLTTFDDEQYIVESLIAGAVGYVLKDIPSEELADAVRSAHRKIYRFDERAVHKLAELLERLPTPASKKPHTPIPLTDRERDVLLLVARGHSNQEIADHLNISEGTVKNHISSILGQLHLRDRIQLIIYAYEHGWVG